MGAPSCPASSLATIIYALAHARLGVKMRKDP